MKTMKELWRTDEIGIKLGGYVVVSNNPDAAAAQANALSKVASNKLRRKAISKYRAS